VPYTNSQLFPLIEVMILFNFSALLPFIFNNPSKRELGQFNSTMIQDSRDPDYDGNGNGKDEQSIQNTRG